MEHILERGNLLKALQKVVYNGGNPGINGMTVKDLPHILNGNGREYAGSY